MNRSRRNRSISGITSALAISLIIPGISSAASAKALTGAQVLDKCQATYDKMSTYKGDVTAHTLSPMGAGMNLTCVAHVQFKRPGYIRVDGSGMMGSSYAYVSNGTTTEVNAFGGWSKTSPMMAISAATGIGMHSATTVPGMLLQMPMFEMGGMAGTDSAVLVSRNASVAGHSCYEVTVQSPYSITYWVDRRTMLLVKTFEDLSGFMASMSNVMGMSGKHAKMTITLNVANPTVNQPIPARVFALPKVTSNNPLLNPTNPMLTPKQTKG